MEGCLPSAGVSAGAGIIPPPNNKNKCKWMGAPVLRVADVCLVGIPAVIYPGLDHPAYLTFYQLSLLPTFNIHYNKIAKRNTW